MSFDEDLHPRDERGRWTVAGRDVAAAVGFDASKIDIKEDFGPLYSADGVSFNAGGIYDPATDRISLWPLETSGEDVDRGLIAHEIMHAKLYAVERQVIGEFGSSYIGSRADIEKLSSEGGTTPYSDMWWRERDNSGTFRAAISETLSEIAREDYETRHAGSTVPMSTRIDNRDVFESKMRVSHPEGWKLYQQINADYATLKKRGLV